MLLFFTRIPSVSRPKDDEKTRMEGLFRLQDPGTVCCKARFVKVLGPSLKESFQGGGERTRWLSSSGDRFTWATSLHSNSHRRSNLLAVPPFYPSTSSTIHTSYALRNMKPKLEPKPSTDSKIQVIYRSFDWFHKGLKWNFYKKRTFYSNLLYLIKIRYPARQLHPFSFKKLRSFYVRDIRFMDYNYIFLTF